MKLAILIIFILPLLSSIITGLFKNSISSKAAGLIASSNMIFAAIAAISVFYLSNQSSDPINFHITQWLTIGELDISWSIYVDRLSSIMFATVTIVSAVVHVYSIGYMAGDPNIHKFFSFLSLFTFFMLMLVAANNFMQLFFGWEGVGLCSYLLIGFWYEKPTANAAATKAFVVNRIGDFAFILGVILIAKYTDSLNFHEIFIRLPALIDNNIIIFGHEFTILDLSCLLLFLGCMGKSAQIGLHIWLPDAMEGPTPVSALIHAATMVTAGVFLIARCSYIFEYSPIVLNIIALVGGITALFAATIAVAQTDIKKIIAYSTCSQLGYMFLACGVSAYRAAIFHLVTHAFFKALLFLSAGSVIHASHEQDITKMGDLKDKMPITYANFLVGSLAIIGIFPLAGFYSKDMILESAYGASLVGNVVFILGIISALFTAIYSMKIIVLTFHGKTNFSVEMFNKIHEATKVMNIPLIILVAGSFCVGMIGHYILLIDKQTGYLLSSIFNLREHSHHVSIFIKFLPLFIGLFGLGLGIMIYTKRLVIKTNMTLNFIYQLFKNKYYFDEIYNLTIVKFMTCLSLGCSLFDQKVIDKFLPGSTVQITSYTSDNARKIQTGYIYHYSFIMILAISMLMTYLLINSIFIH